MASWAGFQKSQRKMIHAGALFCMRKFKVTAEKETESATGIFLCYQGLSPGYVGLQCTRPRAYTTVAGTCTVGQLSCHPAAWTDCLCMTPNDFSHEETTDQNISVSKTSRMGRRWCVFFRLPLFDLCVHIVRPSARISKLCGLCLDELEVAHLTTRSSSTRYSAHSTINLRVMHLENSSWFLY